MNPTQNPLRARIHGVHACYADAFLALAGMHTLSSFPTWVRTGYITRHVLLLLQTETDENS